MAHPTTPTHLPHRSNNIETPLHVTKSHSIWSQIRCGQITVIPEHADLVIKTYLLRYQVCFQYRGGPPEGRRRRRRSRLRVETFLQLARIKRTSGLRASLPFRAGTRSALQPEGESVGKKLAGQRDERPGENETYKMTPIVVLVQAMNRAARLNAQVSLRVESTIGEWRRSRSPFANCTFSIEMQAGHRSLDFTYVGWQADPSTSIARKVAGWFDCNSVCSALSGCVVRHWLLGVLSRTRQASQQKFTLL